ncbi:portal protein [Oricola sp.]|uniref:portal protein n=1 Tax=Oricola sp. TaxID=1979950 RepID=UPI0025F12945|nr:portal protein [Oricola sp.]MCI5075651.1 portal protein [Oricola sp.]
MADTSQQDMPARDLKRTSKACEAAYQDCSGQKARLDELYEYVLPYRAPSGTGSATTSGRVDRVFDSTATKAAFRFAGRMQQDVTPAFQRFFELKVGPYLNIDGDEKKAIEEELAIVTAKVSAVIEGADFAVSSGEMYLDLFGGTGAMLILEHEHDIARFLAVPIGEIALREDGAGHVNGIYWKKEFKASNIPGMWKSARLSDRLRRLIEDEPETKVSITQACEFDEESRMWEFSAFDSDHGKDEGSIHAVNERTCPWITPRFYKVPGEAMGRGPGLMGLPTAKTLNKVTELSIKAAAFAILGLWIYRNDRVFNPKTAKMAPGAMWPVGATGGTMGASIQKLDVPGRFDISNLILQDLRENVKQVMLDDTLPPDSGAVRSATEIVERMKRLSQDLSGAYARLILEIIKPLVQRIIDILYRRKLLKVSISIDQLITRVEVVSPIAKQQQAQDVSSLVEWLQITAGLGGREMMMLTAKVEDVFTEIGRKLGIPERFLRSETDKKKIQQALAQMIAQQQQQPEPAQPPPAQPIA